MQAESQPFVDLGSGVTQIVSDGNLYCNNINGGGGGGNLMLQQEQQQQHLQLHNNAAYESALVVHQPQPLMQQQQLQRYQPIGIPAPPSKHSQPSVNANDPFVDNATVRLLDTCPIPDQLYQQHLVTLERLKKQYPEYVGSKPKFVTSEQLTSKLWEKVNVHLLPPGNGEILHENMYEPNLKAKKKFDIGAPYVLVDIFRADFRTAHFRCFISVKNENTAGKYEYVEVGQRDPTKAALVAKTAGPGGKKKKRSDVIKHGSTSFNTLNSEGGFYPEHWRALFPTGLSETVELRQHCDATGKPTNRGLVLHNKSGKEWRGFRFWEVGVLHLKWQNLTIYLGKPDKGNGKVGLIPPHYHHPGSAKQTPNAELQHLASSNNARLGNSSVLSIEGGSSLGQKKKKSNNKKRKQNLLTYGEDAGSDSASSSNSNSGRGNSDSEDSTDEAAASRNHDRRKKSRKSSHQPRPTPSTIGGRLLLTGPADMTSTTSHALAGGDNPATVTRFLSAHYQVLQGKEKIIERLYQSPAFKNLEFITALDTTMSLFESEYLQQTQRIAGGRNARGSSNVGGHSAAPVRRTSSVVSSPPPPPLPPPGGQVLRNAGRKTTSHSLPKPLVTSRFPAGRVAPLTELTDADARL